MPAILPRVRIICNSVRNVEMCISCRRNCNKESIKVEIILVFNLILLMKFCTLQVINKCCLMAIDLVIKRMECCE